MGREVKTACAEKIGVEFDRLKKDHNRSIATKTYHLPEPGVGPRISVFQGFSATY